MRRGSHLRRMAASRRSISAGRSIRVIGRSPLTLSGTYGGFPLCSYTVNGGFTREAEPTPDAPVYPAFTGKMAENLASGILHTAGAGEERAYPLSLPTGCYTIWLCMKAMFSGLVSVSLGGETVSFSGSYAAGERTEGKDVTFYEEVSAISLRASKQIACGVAILRSGDTEGRYEIALSVGDREVHAEAAEPLRAVSGTADTLSYPAGTLTRRIAALALCGSESGWVQTAPTGQSFACFSAPVLKGRQHGSGLLCSHLPELSQTEISGGTAAGFAVHASDPLRAEMLFCSLPRSALAKYGIGSEGSCVQSGEPTPSSPVPITSRIPAGTYAVPATDGGSGYWRFTLGEDLHALKGTADILAVNPHAGTVRVLRRFTERILKGGSDEAWRLYSVGTSVYTIFPHTSCFAIQDESYSLSIGTSICTHFQNSEDEGGYHPISGEGLYSDHNNYRQKFFTWGPSGKTLAEFKAWLAAENAAGTPVRLIYQLKTPLTESITATRTNSMAGASALPAAISPGAIDESGIVTLPACLAWLAGESTGGTPLTLWYEMADTEITEECVSCPAIPASEGETTLTVPGAGRLSFSAFCRPGT